MYFLVIKALCTSLIFFTTDFVKPVERRNVIVVTVFLIFCQALHIITYQKLCMPMEECSTRDAVQYHEAGFEVIRENFQVAVGLRVTTT